MKKYKVFVPEWKVEVLADDINEAVKLAGEIYDSHREQDDAFGNFMAVEVNQLIDANTKAKAIVDIIKKKVNAKKLFGELYDVLVKDISKIINENAKT